jgi:hypothetical protein
MIPLVPERVLIGIGPDIPCPLPKCNPVSLFCQINCLKAVGGCDGERLAPTPAVGVTNVRALI